MYKMSNQQYSIITPDQKLRVFVSSTLHELEEERKVIMDAIKKIHLIPVMFELGARPHAPRNLYREYLNQSQIFIGIYWNQYGWVAPEEEVSGIEDEYNLSVDLPRLIYIKKSDKRDERLELLIRKIQKDDSVSYKTFQSSSELQELIINDLAILLTEKFYETQNHEFEEEKLPDNLPRIPNDVIGQEACLNNINNYLVDPETRLITLFGPGGIGKTRLAIECGRMNLNYFKQGVHFIPLADVKDPKLVASVICKSLNIRNQSGNPSENLKLFLKNKNALLILDNFEQIIGAAYLVNDLLMSCPMLTIMTTSRESLALSFEQLVSIPPLPEKINIGTSDYPYSPAVELFVNRARHINPNFMVTEENRNAIEQIVHHLEGHPLSIELAAGQINILTPAMILQKLSSRLDFLKANFKDIPDRQKTIRNTIAWSFDLLDNNEKNILQLIVSFNSGCTLFALEEITKHLQLDVMHICQSLINKSLLFTRQVGNTIRFYSLQYIKEFCNEKTEEGEGKNELMERKSNYYLQVLETSKLHINVGNQSMLIKELEQEHPNFIQVLEYLLDQKDLKRFSIISWNLWLFWWVNANASEVYPILLEAEKICKDQGNICEHDVFCKLQTNLGIMAFMQHDFKKFKQCITDNFDQLIQHNDIELIATTYLLAGVADTVMKNFSEADKKLRISLDYFERTSISSCICIALSAHARNETYQGKWNSAVQLYEKSLKIARQNNIEISIVMNLAGIALSYTFAKKAEAKIYLIQGIDLSYNLHFYEALAWCLDIWSMYSYHENKFEHSIKLISAVEHLRQLTQVQPWPDLHEKIVVIKNTIYQSMHSQDFDKLWNSSRNLTIEEIIFLAKSQI